MMQATEKQMAEQQEKLIASRNTLEEQKQEYKEFTFQNPYADVENFYEDIQVDTQAADFQMEQAAQQRANILSSLRGAAGASGIGGLAQALANQATMQARQVSVDIGRQERRAQIMARQGAQQADMLRRQGEYGQAAGAEAGVQAAYGNEMAAFGASSQMQSARMGMYGSIIGGVAGGIATGGMGNMAKGLTFFGKSTTG